MNINTARAIIPAILATILATSLSVGVCGADSPEQPNRTVPELIDALKDESLAVRRTAMLEIHSAGPKAKSAVPALIAILQQNDPTTRKYAINAFIGIGPDARSAVPILVEMLSCDDFHTQYWACRALGAIGADAKPAVPKLIELVQGGVASVRRNAAAALGRLGPTIGEPGLNALVEAMSDRTQAVRQQAVIALGKLGPLAAPGLPAIERGLRAGGFKPAANAARTLWLLKPESDLPLRVLLVELASGDDPYVAVDVLGEIGVELGAVEEVAELLKLEYRWARLYAAETLGKMGPDAASIARPALEAALAEEDEEVREMIKEALQKIRPADQKSP